jgi:hypothetical protein
MGKYKLYTTTEMVKQLDISYSEFHSIIEYLELEPAKVGTNSAGKHYRLYDSYTKKRVELYLEELEENDCVEELYF